MIEQLSMTFDAPRARELAKQGIARAEANQADRVALARELAVEIAQRQGTVTSDDVRRAFAARGLPWLGNAAGGIFRDPRFRWTGKYATSQVVEGHGNQIRVWRLA